MDWIREHKVISIVGNTDKKVIKLLDGKDFKKPAKEEKRIMYSRAARILTDENSQFLCSLKKKCRIKIDGFPVKIEMYHGSPDDPDEFLFDTTPETRFQEIAKKMHDKKVNIVLIGHSHTPFHKEVDGVHFINPGSVGRMFDGNPEASCAVLSVTGDAIKVQHHRIDYPVNEVIARLREKGFPEIYCQMYSTGRKLN